MPTKILQREAPVLRKISEEIKTHEIESQKIQKILSEMKEALDSQDDGVAIAAPQIGYTLRIFIVSKKVVGIIKNKKRNKGDDEEDQDNNEGLKDIVFINPVIKKLSQEKKTVEEGCLSVRYLYGKVKRNHKATIEAYNENGKKFTMGGVGLMAQIFQHEVDHLDGVLFTDKAKDLEEIPPEDISIEKDEKGN